MTKPTYDVVDLSNKQPKHFDLFQDLLFGYFRNVTIQFGHTLS